MFKRLLQPPLTRSFFLFGPRSTGKSTLLQTLLPPEKALWLDLLDLDLERTLSTSPSKLIGILNQEKERSPRREWVVIDEVQKIPELLSVVHQSIQKREFKFALTGSSARKLKRGGANMLGGRASWFELYSLTHLEIGERFNLDEVLNWGSLPELFELSPADRVRFLKAYCLVYLKEEIVAEQLIRKVQPFRQFLELAALQNAQIINYSKFATDCQVDITTIQTYFEILQDTLIGFELQPFELSVRKRQRKNPKFYFFDNGVTRALSHQIESQLVPQTSLYGKCFEQFVVTEIFRLMKCQEKEWRLSYLMSKDGVEVDLIIEMARGERIAIEIKSSNSVEESKARTFERLAKDIPGARLMFLSQNPIAQRIGDVECLHWKEGLEAIFNLAS